MSIPSGAGLFHRAGVMSGSTLRVQTAQTAQWISVAYLKILGLDKSKAVMLQTTPFTALLAAQVTLEAPERGRGEAPRSFSPSLDGAVIPGHPFDPKAPAVSAKIPMGDPAAAAGRVERPRKRHSPPGSPLSPRRRAGSGGAVTRPA